MVKKLHPNVVVPSLSLAAFSLVAFTQAAEADCFYYQPDEQNPVLKTATINTNTILGDRIPVQGSRDSDQMFSVGELLNFECLHEPQSVTPLPPRDLTPSNIERLPAVDAIVRSRSAKDPVRMDFTTAVAVLKADVTCEDITLGFSPETLPVFHNKNDSAKYFMQNIITVLSTAEENHAQGKPYTGRYELEVGGGVRFTPDPNGTRALCLTPGV